MFAQRIYTAPFIVFFKAIDQVANGDFVATGSYFYSPFTGDEYIWVVKLGQEGNKVSEQAFDSKEEQSDGEDVTATADGGYILAGAHNIPGSLNSNPFVLRLDVAGNKLWEQVYSDYQVYVLLDSGVAETETGNFILAFKSLLMEIDCCGKIIWAHQSDALNMDTVAFLPGANPVFGGSLIVNNFDHAYVTALDSQGETIL